MKEIIVVKPVNLGPSDLEKLWTKNLDFVKKYVDVTETYNQLCLEVEYILKRGIKQVGIVYSSVTSRVKSLESVSEKIVRKGYMRFEEITDLAGVRLVYLYESDFGKIDKIIRSKFDVLEVVDKVSEQGENLLGYSAVHYIIKIKKIFSGERYEDIGDLICEIQVRTLLQDAWAVVGHNLEYKQEWLMPSNLRKELKSLVGLFATADSQFDNIRKARLKYVEKLSKRKFTKKAFFKEEINQDTLIAYLRWRFSDLALGSGLAFEFVTYILEREAFRKIGALEGVVVNTEKARKDISEREKQIANTALRELLNALLLTYPSYVDRGFIRSLKGPKMEGLWRIHVREYDYIKKYKL
jgi:putative GTP pyrophosphokinase